MSLIGVIIGSICQVLLAIPLFMFAAIGADIASGILFILPLSCLFSAGLVIYFFLHDGTTLCYLWYGFPLILFLFSYLLLGK